MFSFTINLDEEKLKDLESNRKPKKKKRKSMSKKEKQQAESSKRINDTK